MMKRLVCLLLALMMLLSVSGAFAAKKINGGTTVTPTSQDVKTFKFEHRKKGINCGVCPVYSAPYQDAYRAANGKATVDANHSIDVGGFNSQGWLLVRYDTNNGSSRTGWIPPKYVKNVTTKMSPHFAYVEQTATKDYKVTDNCKDPHDASSVFALIEEGETYHVVAKYTYTGYNLLYIAFDLDDQVAWGFIEE